MAKTAHAFHKSLAGYVAPALAALSAFVFSGCYSYSAFQSARLLAPGEYSVSPAASFDTFRSGDHARWVMSNYGAQVAAGVGGMDKLNVTARYERMDGREYTIDGIDSAGIPGQSFDQNYNYSEVGFKFGLVPDHVAFTLPIGLMYGGDIDKPSDTWQVQPGLLLTGSVGPYVDVTLGSKMLVFFKSKVDNLVAFNLGAGVHAPDQKLSILPEAGMLFDPGEDGYYTYFGLGLSFKFGAPVAH
jgi:hypothetical protein